MSVTPKPYQNIYLLNVCQHEKKVDLSSLSCSKIYVGCQFSEKLPEGNNSQTYCGVSDRNALRFRLTASVVQPRRGDDLLTYKASGSNYLSFVVTSMLVSTSPLDEAGTATLC